VSNNAMLNQVNNGLAQHPTYTSGTPGTYTPDTLSLPDILIKTAACLGVVLVAAVPGWIYLAGTFVIYLGILVVTMIVGVIMMRKAPVKAPLALGYSALLGLIVGAFSHSAVAYGGNVALIPQAVLGTAAGTVAVLAIYSTPFGKKASKATRLFFALMIGYLLIGVASAVAAIFFGTGDGWGFYGVGGLGIILCVVGVAMAAWSLLMDIGSADRALQAGAPANYDWTFGVSLAASIVWLYLELLRLLSIVSR